MEVDEPGKQHRAVQVVALDGAGVPVGGGTARVGPDRGDETVADEHVDGVSLPVRPHPAQ